MLLKCIAIGYFCCLLVNNIAYIFFSWDLYTCNEYLSYATFKFSGVKVLAVQLFNKIKRKKKMNKLIKTCFSVFPTCYDKIFLINFVIFKYILDIYVSRNGNNLKLKVKSEFSSMGLMLINHSNPYIYSTTVLCDIEVLQTLILI